MSRFSHYEQCPRCLEKGRDNRGDNLARYVDGGGHCFACGYYIPVKRYSKPIQKEEINGAKSIPADFSREDVPARAWEWLLQWGLPYSYWKPFVGWSEKDSRLVITFGSEFSIGRYIPEAALAVPSKDTKVPRKWYVYGNSHQSAHVFGDYQKSKEVVLVEDPISAHKLAFSPAPKDGVDHEVVGRTAIPLFGTRVFDRLVPVLRHIGLPLVFWLDKDQEHTMPKKCDGLATLTGLGVRYVVTDNDPKALSFEAIGATLA